MGTGLSLSLKTELNLDRIFCLNEENEDVDAETAGNEDGIIPSLFKSCQDTSTVCFISGEIRALVLEICSLFFNTTEASPSTFIISPLAVNNLVELFLFTFRPANLAKSEEISVWLLPVSGRQLTRTPLLGLSAGRSHNGVSGVGRFAAVQSVCAGPTH
jgi:hypothetical protein